MLLTFRRLYSLFYLRWYPESYKNVFIILSLSWIILYVFVLFRLWDNAVFYLNNINYFYRLYMATILLIFFNPWTKIGFDDFHKNLIFSVALYLIASTTLTDFIMRTQTVALEAAEDAEKLVKLVTPTTTTPHTPSLTAFLS